MRGVLGVGIVSFTMVAVFCLLFPSMATATTTYYRSVGTGGTLVSGSQGIGEGAYCTSGSPIVTFGSGTTLPADVGEGDKLTINGTVEGYILTRDSDTKVTLQSNCTNTNSDEDFQIDRAYASITAWVSDRQRDLTAATGDDSIEVAVCYKDGPINEKVIIDGFTTGENNYVKIWVPPGQRHTGTAGTGFFLRYEYSGTSGQRLFQIDDEYVRVEGVEIDGSEVSAPYVYGFIPRTLVSETDSDIRFDKVLVHDLKTNTTSDVYGAHGIYFRHGSGRVTNSTVYNIENQNPNASADASGIRGNSGGTVSFYNNTVYNVSNTGSNFNTYGIWRETGTVTAINNYAGGTSCSLCGTSNYDFYGSFESPDSDYNISEDSTAPGDDSLTGKAPGDQFESISEDSEDLHLKAGSDCFSSGTNLSGTFTDDIDGQTRPTGVNPWDVGADEVDGDCKFVYRRSITIDGDKVGGSSGYLEDFPVLVDLSGDWLKNYPAGDIQHSSGWDIIFRGLDSTTCDGTPPCDLDHEIEYYADRDIEIATGTFTTPASTGTDSVEGVGFEPKAILLWGTAVTDESVAVHSAQWIGFADDATPTRNQKVVSVTGENGVADPDTLRHAEEDKVLYIVNADGATTIAQATVSSYDSDGFTLDYSATSSGYIVHYVAFGGESLQAFVGQDLWNGSPVDGMSFRPELVFAASACKALADGDTYGNQSFGVFNDDLNQWYVASDQGYESTAASEGEKDSVLYTDGFIGQQYQADRTWYLDVTSVNSDGFSWSTTGSGGSDVFYFLALSLSGLDTFVGNFTKETTGSDPVSQDLPDFGFTPRFYMLASASETDEVDNTPNSSRVTLGVYDGTTQHSTTRTDEKITDSSNQNADQRSSSSAVLGISALDAAYDALATAQPITDSTPTIEWSPNDTNAYIIGIVGIEDPEGDLVAWVRVPKLYAGNNDPDNDTVIYMYYGNGCINDDPQDAAGVWSNGYAGVWHLSENQDGTANPDLYQDSTASANHGDDNVSATAQTGQADGGQQFDGTDDIVDIPDPGGAWEFGDDGLDAGTSDFTISAWVWLSTEATESFPTIVAKGGGSDTNAGYWFNYRPGDDWLDVRVADGTNRVIFNTPAAIGLTDEEWHHVCVVFDRSPGSDTAYFYLDGNPKGSEESTDIADNSVSGDDDFEIGHKTGGTPRPWMGNLDEVRISSEIRTAEWVETCFNNQESPSTFYTLQSSPDEDPPTAVTLRSFTALGDGGKVRVAWETVQEIDTLGFNLYRSSDRDGSYTKLNSDLVPGLIYSVVGRRYTYEDTDVSQGRLYYYKLEEVEVGGESAMHGPVCVDWDGDGIGDDWETAYGLNPGVDEADLDYDGDGLSNLEEYQKGTDPFDPDTDGDGLPDGMDTDSGDPDGDSQTGVRLSDGFRIIESDESGMVIELETSGLLTEEVEVSGTTYQRVLVEDYHHGYTEKVGSPQVPLKGLLVDVPEGMASAVEIEAVETTTYDGYMIYPSPGYELSDEGTLCKEFALNEDIYGTDSFYPGSSVSLGETLYLRGQKKAKLLFYPLQFNPVTGELTLQTRIRVRVGFEPELEAMALLSLGSGPWRPCSNNSVYKVSVFGEGIYGMGYDYLVAHGVDVGEITDTRRIKLYNQGSEVPLYVSDGGDTSFDAGDYIAFYAEPFESKYSRSDIYWLVTDGAFGLRMAERDGTNGSLVVPTEFETSIHLEEDLSYIGTASGSDERDRWFWCDLGDETTYLYGANPAELTLSLPDTADTTSDVVIRLFLESYYDGEHQIDVSLNGTSLGQLDSWSGTGFHEAEITAGQVLLDKIDGQNTLNLETTVDSELTLVDWVEVTYERGFEAEDNRIKFTAEAGDYRFEFSGFTEPGVELFDITDPTHPVRLTNFDSGTWGLEESPTESSTYLAMVPQEPQGVIVDIESNLSDNQNQADYLIITHEDLYDAASALVDHRTAQGLNVEVVTTEDIYDEFSYGIESPHGIKDFLEYAYQNWREPAPTYVLLLGDGTYDYKDNLGLGTTNHVPPYLVVTDYMGETASDGWFVQIGGDDLLVDMHMGRLPASSLAEAELMIEKIIEYEEAPNTKSWEKHLVFARGDEINEAEEALFRAMNEDVLSLVPAFYDISRTYGTTQPIEGALLVNYSGHGYINGWRIDGATREMDYILSLLNTSDTLPLFVTMTCLNGYFVHETTRSLAEELLLSMDGGAIATLSPTGMTVPSGQRLLDHGLFEAVFEDDTRELGPALLSAKAYLLANSTTHDDVAKTFQLFGDPAMKLKIPLPQRPPRVSTRASSDGITISWEQTQDADGNPVSGYNLYRSTTPGNGYTRVNTALITGTTYHDTDLEKGLTYCYVVSSVDSHGYESLYSEEVSDAIVATSETDPQVPTPIASSESGGCFIEVARGGFSSVPLYTLLVMTAIAVIWLASRKKARRTE